MAIASVAGAAERIMRSKEYSNDDNRQGVSASELQVSDRAETSFYDRTIQANGFQTARTIVNG